MELLIIGASSYVGTELYTEACRRNIKVLGTKCKSESANLLEFDLQKDSIKAIASQFTSEHKWAVICSAITNIDFCYENQDKAYDINVTSTIRLMRELTEMGYRIIFFSSDNVFDGTKDYYTEEDEQSPINEYGRMKAEVEQYITKNLTNACVMRIGKVVGNAENTKDMFYQLILQAKRNEVIYCIRNNLLALSHVEDIVNCVFIIMGKHMSGIYNIVGNEIYKRKSLVEQFFEYVNVHPVIHEKDLEEFNFKAKRPLKYGLRNEKFKKETGYEFTSLEQLFSKYGK